MVIADHDGDAFLSKSTSTVGGLADAYHVLYVVSLQLLHTNIYIYIHTTNNYNYNNNNMCHRVRYRQGARPQRRQRGNQPNTAVSHLATCLFQWLLRRWVLWQMRHNFFWQRLAGEQRYAQPIRGKPRFCTNGFLWQFSGLMPYAWATRWLFPSPHRNHSRHRSTLC